jgi:starch synthase
VATSQPLLRALFVNAGILGLQTFADFVQGNLVGDRDGIHVEQIVLTSDLTPWERAVRRLLCARCWPDGAVGLRNLDLHRFRAEWHAGLLARRRIRRLEGSMGRFDVLHFHRQPTAYASLDRMRQTPSIVSIDCTQRCVLQSSLSRLETVTYRPNIARDGEIFRAAALIVATSQWAAKSLREEYPECTTDIAVMGDPVNLALFDREWAHQRYLRAFDNPDYRPRVLFVGGDFPRKGGYDLLDAWREGGLGARAVLDIVSGWPVDGRRLPEGVRVHRGVTAHSPEWQAVWRDSDIFVLPTRDEAFGLVYQEAAAAGLPAIGTRINAVPELVEDGGSGLLVNPADRTQLIDALEGLIASPERRLALGRRGRERVEATADPHAYRQFLVAAIRKVAGR